MKKEQNRRKTNKETNKDKERKKLLVFWEYFECSSKIKLPRVWMIPKFMKSQIPRYLFRSTETTGQTLERLNFLKELSAINRIYDYGMYFYFSA